MMFCSCGQGTPKGFVATPDDTARDTVATFDYGRLTKLGHPRILMTAKDFKFLRKAVSAKGNPDLLSQVNTILIGLSDHYADNPEKLVYKVAPGGEGILGTSRAALRRLFFMAYAYRVTGVQKYLDAAVADLRTVCGYKDWSPSHYLDVAEMSLGVAIAYDWLFYDLPNDVRELARVKLIEYGLKTYPGQWYLDATNNWNQVCNAGMIAAALAVYEKDKALAVEAIEKAIPSNRNAMKTMYAPDGAYPEGYNYWGYGTGFEAILLQMLQTAFGSTADLEQAEGFLPSGKFMLFMDTPTGGSFSFADGGNGKEIIQAPMWWFAGYFGDESMLAYEKQLMNKGMYSDTDGHLLQSGQSYNRRLMPAIPSFILHNGFKGEGAGKPSQNLWHGDGIVPLVMVHTGWNYDEGDHYLGIKGGAAISNHGHMDSGSFVYESQGVRWSDDIGNPNYSFINEALKNAGGGYWDMRQVSLRWDIVKMNNLAHSTLSFMNSDGSVPDKVHVSDHVVSGKGTIEECFDSAEGKGARIDMTAAVSDAVASAKRTFLVTGKGLVVEDEVTAKPGMAAKLQWRMLTPASVTVTKEGNVLTQKGKTLKMTVTSSSASVVPAYASWTMDRPKDWTPRTWDPDDSQFSIAGFTATIPAGTTVKFTTVLAD